MIHIFSKRWAIILLIITPMLVSLACKFQAGAPSTTAPATDTPASDELTIEVVFGLGPFNFPDTKSGLTDLASYKATLVMSFNGTEAGQPQHWSKTYIMLNTKEPAAHQLTIEKTGNLSNLDTVFMAESNGASYERRGENDCIATVIEEGNALTEQLEPVGFLNGVIGADEAGNETVNAVAANHYTFDERAYGQLNIAQSTGELWVAFDGGYIVKYLLTTKGNADYFGEGIEGTLTWDYELTGINQPVTITLPNNCPGGLVNAPQLPDASNILNMPGILTYDTATSLADAAAFYQKEIPNLGWKLVNEPSLTDTSALLDYIQGDKTLTIIITSDKIKTAVNMLLGKSQGTVPSP
ncbi:MAG: hypothetical protein NTW69_01955 [Chloroflexi bacterium]|nr:hypothetical protein [Chloroflexota bacterium]